MASKDLAKAAAYLRTFSAVNVGADIGFDNEEQPSPGRHIVRLPGELLLKLRK